VEQAADRVGEALSSNIEFAEIIESPRLFCKVCEAGCWQGSEVAQIAIYLARMLSPS